MSKKSARPIIARAAAVTEDQPATLEDLRRFAADCARELETIQARLSMINCALVLEGTIVCADAARLLQLDIENPLHECAERARRLVTGTAAGVPHAEV